MAKHRTTHLTIVLDRSGSMDSVRDDAIGGFNAFLEQQRKLPGAASLTLVQFDHEYEVVHAGRDVDDVPPLTRDTFLPRGNTALYDAVGRAIAETDERVGGEKEPHVVVGILTDGHENASKELDYKKLQKLIKKKTAAGWEFLFLAANMDAVQAAEHIGISAASAVSFDADAAGTRAAFGAMSERIAESRRTRDSESKSSPKKIH